MKSVTGNYYVSAQYYKFGRTTNYSTLLSVNLWWQKISGTLSFSSVSQKMKLENAVYEARVGYRFNNKIYNELAVYYRSPSKSLNARNRFNYQFSNKLNAYCELNYNTQSKNYNVSFGVSWRLPWMQFRGGMYQSKYATSAFATASGSMLLYEKMDLAFTHRLVSGSSLQIVPFLDINGNGEMDQHEPVMSDSKLVIRTGADMQKTKNGIFFNNIPPNRGFKVIVPRQAYEDITWQIEPQEICLTLAPYQSRTIHIPVKILTELAGQISVNPQGQTGVMDGVPITITITNLKTGNVTRIQSDDWGYYSSMVVCGEYVIELDTKTLEQTGVTCANPVRHVTIESSREGQQLIDLHFVCTAKPVK